MLLSILTPTLVERRERFRALNETLQRQIEDDSFTERVEHLFFEDNREHSIGCKRNVLMDRAKGEFIVFVDDDDDVSFNYVSLICRGIVENPEIDCMSIRGTICFNGSHPHEFVQSLEYQKFYKKNNIYCRPLMHINPVRRAIAVRYRFEDISYSEDIDRAMRMYREGAIKKEHLIREPLYFYNSGRAWWYQCFIDRTEDIRQALGLQLVNRVRFQRWMRDRLRR